MKRFVSLLLVVIIVASAMPLSVFAAYPLGDVNNDGSIDTEDARLTLKCAVNIEMLSKSQLKAADIDKDGEVTVQDARLILRVFAGLDSIEFYNVKRNIVRFDLNYDGAGDPPELQRVEEGKTAVMPIQPERDGYYFLGWYESTGHCVAWDFKTGVTKNMSLYAKWFSTANYIDSDSDGLPDDLENAIGSDPKNRDSDKDGLGDFYEVYYLNYDPLSSDTDKDGVKDCDEDLDGDGLTEKDEEKNSTYPNRADSDSDDLNDYDEIYTYSTNPLLRDTDRDGMSDGEEVRLGSDPKVYNETFVTEVSNGTVTETSPVALKVVATADRYSSGNIEINTVDNTVLAFTQANIGYIAPGYSITAPYGIEEAQLIFSYDESLIGDDFVPAVYYYDRDDNELEEIESVDDGHGTVSARVTHFSEYILLNKAAVEAKPAVYINDVDKMNYRDTNDDGIDDYIEKLINDGDLLYDNSYWLQGVTDMYGAYCDDWDGDGLLNGEEIDFYVEGGQIKLFVKSNPLLIDSDFDGFDDYSEVARMHTDPMKYDHDDSSAVRALLNDSQYLFASSERDWRNYVSYGLDWSKYDEAKEALINFIYDYAPTGTIEKNAERIEAYNDSQKALEWISAGSTILGTLRDLSKLSKGSLAAANAEQTYYENIDAKKNMLSDMKAAKAKTELVTSELKLVNLPGKLQNTMDAMQKAYEGEASPEDYAEMFGFIGIGSTAIGIYNKLNDFEILNLADSFGDFTKFAGSLPNGALNKIDIPGSLDIICTVGESVAETAEIVSLYSKIQANADAFNELTELLLTIKEIADCSYVRDAAADIAAAVIDKTNTQFYAQLVASAGKNLAFNAAKTAISAAAKSNAYLLILDTFISLFGFTGVSDMSRSYVCFDVMRIMGTACRCLLEDITETEGSYFEYDNDDASDVEKYLVQLAQSRIIGEKYWYEYLTASNGASWLASLFSSLDSSDYERMYKNAVKSVYGYSNRLGLLLSSNLPFFDEFSDPGKATSTNLRFTGIDEEGKWIVDIDSIPESVKDFIDYFNWCGAYFDCEDPLNHTEPYANIVYLIARIGGCCDRRIYPGKDDVNVWDSTTPDPLNKYKYYNNRYSYLKVDASKVKWIAENIFHISTADYNKLKKEAKDNDLFYEYDGWFYSPSDGIGSPIFSIVFDYVTYDGEKMYVNYHNADDRDGTYMSGPYYAEISLDTIDGEQYVTLYRNKMSDGPGLFAALSKNNYFSKIIWNNGVTSLKIDEDGYFSGDYFFRDSYEQYEYCDFYGKFKNPKRIKDYIYSVEVDYINVYAADYYSDNVHFIPFTEAIKAKAGDIFTVYLKRCPLNELPENADFFIENLHYDWDRSKYGDYLLYAVIDDGHGSWFVGP